MFNNINEETILGEHLMGELVTLKKVVMFYLLFIFMYTSSVQALSWAYAFVVWDGKVYKVTEEKLLDSEIGESIGEVETKPNDMTGNYYGNASNSYPKGTKYFKINDIPTSAVIAVEVEDDVWQKAVYVHKAPFHWMNLFTNIVPIIILIVIFIICLLFFIKVKRRKLSL